MMVGRLAILLWSVPALAQESSETSESDEELVVEGSHPDDSPSARRLDRTTVEATPARSADELLRAMPGLHVSRHGGRGKAMQFFLRGFDAVHGADLAVEVDGVPLNEPGNVHAHGYLDLYLLPPALVNGLTLSPGPRRAEDGDFAVAGTAQFDLGLDHTGLWTELGGGTDRSVFGSATFRPADADSATFVVVDTDVGQGIGDARAWRQLRAAAGFGTDLATTRVHGWILAYDGCFESPGVVREDDVDSSSIDFLGAYPGSGGGHSTRVLAAGSIAGGTNDRAFRVTTYAAGRWLTLTQNYTGALEFPENGDGTIQSTQSWTLGSRLWMAHRIGPDTRLRTGGGVRFDAVQLGEDRVRTDDSVWLEGTDFEALLGKVHARASLPTEPTPWLRIEPGLHTAAFVVAPSGSPSAVAPVVAPTASVTIGHHAPVTGRLVYARGFRSPDPRSVGDDGAVTVATADSAEAGLHASPTPIVALRAVAFVTAVSDEVIFDHVEARYLASGSTLRRGIDGGVALEPTDHLRLSLDATLSDGRYTDTDQPIPYAPTQIYAANLQAERLPVGPVTVTGGLRGWHLAARPLPDGFASPPATVMDATARVERDRFRFSLNVDNLLGAEWWDGTFVYASRWQGETPASQLPVRHITAGAARSVRAAVAWRFL